MNKSIKFRGKRVDNGEWMYGYLCEAFNATLIAEPPFHKCLVDHSTLEVVKETVGQFTGRTDDGGDELYDGDIISFDYELIGYEGVIQWSEDFSAFVVKRKDEEPLFLYDVDDAVTKIGDIYGN